MQVKKRQKIVNQRDMPVRISQFSKQGKKKCKERKEEDKRKRKVLQPQIEKLK